MKNLLQHSILSNIASSGVTVAGLAALAVSLLLAAILQSMEIAPIVLETSTLRTCFVIGLAVSLLLSIVHTFSASASTGLSNDGDAETPSANEDKAALELLKTIPTVLPTIVVVDSDSGLPRLSGWTAPETKSINLILIVDLNFSPVVHSEWPLQSIMCVLGARLADFSESQNGAYALHADTLSLALAMETAPNDIPNILTEINALLTRPLDMGKTAPTVTASFRSNVIDGASYLNLRDLQLSKPVTTALESPPAASLPTKAANDCGHLFLEIN